MKGVSMNGYNRLPDEAAVQRRADGRPEAYDIPPTAVMGCLMCMNSGKMAGYPYKQVFMINPNDNPTNSGTECHLCVEHITEHLPNVVIADPAEGFLCRDLKGKTWREVE